MRTSLAVAAFLLLASPASAEEFRRRPAELFLGLGPGNAVCDNKKPDSQCPVDGAFTLTLGGGWRLHPRWSIGAELGVWGFKVRDTWKGQLASEATDVKLSSFYLGPFGRWYWLAQTSVDAYLQAGFGVGALQGEASNSGGNYKIAVSGLAVPLGIGADAVLSSRFRLGGQALAYLQKSSRVCERLNDGEETCKGATSDQNALPWRLSLVLTVMLGE